MKDLSEIAEQIFFVNNGEIDLLTGAIAQSRFDQIIKRDMQLSRRNQTQLVIISTRLNLENYLETKNQIDLNHIKIEVESELVKTYFLLQNIFRQSDCICRVSTTGFWLFLAGTDRSAGDQLLTRAYGLLPKYLDLAISQYSDGDTQLDWYAQIDQLHFSK
jgi:GGDEF domain-containing protein